MNIFGNAVKVLSSFTVHCIIGTVSLLILNQYTEKGSILVGLSLSDSDKTDADPTLRMLEIKVEDTGKGISAEYLRTRLYTRLSYTQFIVMLANYFQHFAKRMCSPVELDLVYPSSVQLSLCLMELLKFGVK